MALGAFASKTVACTFEEPRVLAQYQYLSETVYKGLAKGNFWLFMDIAPWHWYWNKSPGSFAMCEEQRDATTCVPQVRKVLGQLPWGQEALPKINNLQTNDFIKAGMAKAREFETTPDKNKRPKIQMENLTNIAKHEQGMVLQPLIYKDEGFAWWLKQQRKAWVNWATPTLQLVFASACDTNDPLLKSEAPPDTILEDYDSRMRWILAAADQFHGLMQGIRKNYDKTYMEGQLRIMAGWADMKF